MFSFWRGPSAVLLAFGALWFAGCGGGSSGPTPTPTRTPIPGATATGTPASSNLIIVRLRDANGTVVDGVVSLVAGTDTFRLGTTGGQVSFAGFVVGNYSVSAQVNGSTQSKTFAAIKGTTTVDLVFPIGITPTPAGTIPPAPFGN